MVRFVCTKCKYKFTPKSPRRSDNPPARCPYCAREGSLVREKSAEELVKDVDEMIEEY